MSEAGGPPAAAAGQRAELTTGQVELLMRARGIDTGKPPAIVHAVAAQFEHMLGPLVLSIWEAAGAELSPALAVQLAVQREREATHRGIVARLRERAGDIAVVKGVSIADRYPPGWVRPFNDLDLCAGDARSLFAAWGPLRAEGFRVAFLTVCHRGGREQWAVTFQRDGTRFGELPDRVEIHTTPLVGSLVALSPRPVSATGVAPADVPVLRDLLAILEEGFQRPYSTRDLLDVAVCCQLLSPGAREHLDRIVARHGLLPEHYRLRRMLDDWSPFGVPGGPVAATSLAAARLRRWTAAPGASALHPATLHRWLQRRALPVANRPSDAPASRLRAAAGARVDRAARRVTAAGRERQWRDGLLLSGVVVDPEPLAQDAWGLVPPGAPRFAETPGGRFLLTATAEVTRQDVEAARRGQQD